MLWSDNVLRLLGYEPGDQEPSLELAIERTHPLDRPKFVAFLKAGEGTLDRRIVRPDGEIRHVRGTAGARLAASEDGPECVVGVVQDITEQRRAERRIAMHIAVAEQLAGWEALSTSGPGLLRGLAEALGCSAGELLAVQDERLAPVAQWHDSYLAVPDRAAFRDIRVKPGEGLAGAARAQRRPVTADDVDAETSSARDPMTGRVESRGVVAFPVLVGDDVLAVVVLTAHEPLGLADDERRSLTSIGHELGQFLSRRRGELAPTPLSAREIEVLRLAAQGCTGPKIARELFIEPSTVKTHFENIYAKLGVTDRAAAVARALRVGVIH